MPSLKEIREALEKEAKPVEIVQSTVSPSHVKTTPDLARAALAGIEIAKPTAAPAPISSMKTRPDGTRGLQVGKIDVATLFANKKAAASDGSGPAASGSGGTTEKTAREKAADAAAIGRVFLPKANNGAPDYEFKFGKHKGRFLNDLAQEKETRGYLRWMVRDSDFPRPVKDIVEQVLARA